MINPLKRFGAISIITIILILGIFGVERAYAPDDKPEKLELGGTGYNFETGNFEIKASSKWGTATAGERASFQITATLIIAEESSGRVIGILEDSRDVKIVDGSEENRNRMVDLEALLISWDRNGFTGEVGVEATVKLSNPAGRVIAEGTIQNRIYIGDSSYTGGGPSW